MLRSLETDVKRAGVAIVARIARGDDLVEAARRLQPDVIIMDVEIPGEVRGWQALIALRANEETAQIPVIGYADLDFPWYVPEKERPALESACLELADAYIHPHRLCFEIVAALEKVGVEVHALGGASPPVNDG